MVMVKIFCAHPVLVKCQVIRAVTDIGNTFQCISLLPSSACVHKYLLKTKRELAAAFCILRNGLFIYVFIYLFMYLFIYLFYV